MSKIILDEIKLPMPKRLVRRQSDTSYDHKSVDTIPLLSPSLNNEKP